VSGRVRRALRRLVASLSPAVFVRFYSPTDPELGALGEEVAARHLRARGYAILGRRVKSPLGEIDVLARDGATTVCVEVKSGRVSAVLRRKGEPRTLDLRWRPGLRVDRARLARLRRCARALVRTDRRAGRADLVEVLLDSEAMRWHVIHHQDLRNPIRPGGGFRPA
jgi:putative endonuclease